MAESHSLLPEMVCFPNTRTLSGVWVSPEGKVQSIQSERPTAVVILDYYRKILPAQRELCLRNMRAWGVSGVRVQQVMAKYDKLQRILEPLTASEFIEYEHWDRTMDEIQEMLDRLRPQTNGL